VFIEFSIVNYSHLPNKKNCNEKAGHGPSKISNNRSKGKSIRKKIQKHRKTDPNIDRTTVNRLSSSCDDGK
jgi:hypothetical protein